MSQDITVQDLLLYVLGELRQNLGLTETTCFLCLEDGSPDKLPPSEFFITVTPLPGEFAVPEQIPGHILEQTGFRVRAWFHIETDYGAHAERILSDPEHGYNIIKKKNLQALVGKFNPSWSMANTIAAVKSSPPHYMTNDQMSFLSFTIDFVANYFWNLE